MRLTLDKYLKQMKADDTFMRLIGGRLQQFKSAAEATLKSSTDMTEVLRAQGVLEVLTPFQSLLTDERLVAVKKEKGSYVPKPRASWERAVDRN